MTFDNDVVLLTGGAGFIGQNLLKRLIIKKPKLIIVLDILTYASDFQSIKTFIEKKEILFYKVNITDEIKTFKIFQKYKPNLIINCAAESHVDKSIVKPKNFFETNVFGTINLLENFKKIYNSIELCNPKFIQISTDEVYGSLDYLEKPFIEASQYKPNSPYAASKASSDHIARSWYKTYNLPIITTNCSNNYGPGQFHDKLIPLTIKKCMKSQTIPIYGNGKQIRDWIHVDDHVDAILKIAKNGLPGSKYNIGSANELVNVNLVRKICKILNKKIPISQKKLTNFCDLIKYVEDRPGHDFRYSVDSSKLRRELKWYPKIKFSIGIEDTIDWYINHFKNKRVI